MNLISAEINNYRSIQSIALDMEHDTKIFLGISETGKSNILKALSTLSPNYVFDGKNLRENVDLQKNKFNVIFKMRLDDKEKKEIVKFLKEEYKYFDIDNAIMSNNEYLKIEYILSNNITHTVDCKANKKIYTNELIEAKQLQLKESIKLLKASNEDNVTLKNINTQEDIIINKNTLIDTEMFSVSDESKINPYTISMLFEESIPYHINRYLSDNFKNNVLFWDFDKTNLLPGEIKTSEFISNPSICIPLKKIFELAGKPNIKDEYDSRINSGRKTAWKNCLTDVSNKINKYIKGKWDTIPDNTKILLEENGEYIRISIKDTKNDYEMTDRSDGYKRLMTFLIMVSIDNKINNLQNALILIDSPDLEIDIPSQRYLRDELIEIGKNNYVFFSTHSPYMVDNDDISRHFIVSKKSEITSIEQAEESKHYDNAMMLNALGTTLFDNVKQFNIAFEGYTDKKLFNYGIELMTPTEKTKLQKVGICQFGGLKNLNSFVGIWELICKSKKCVICTDGDKPGVDKKKSYMNNINDEICDLMMYSDFSTGRLVETAEDFLVADYIKKICDEFSNIHNKSCLIDLSKLNNDSCAKMDTINAWLGKFKFNDIESGKYEVERSKLKKMLFSSLKTTDIRDDYSKFLTEIIKKYNL